MKQAVLLFLVSIFSILVDAQSPNVTSVIASSLTGRTVNAHYIGAPTFDEGNAGAAQTWDFSSYTFPSAGSSSYVSPNTAYGYSNFTSCTDALRSVAGGTSSYTFDKLNGNIYSLIGVSQQGPQGSVSIIYDNPLDIYRFPMALNTTFTDNFHAHADYGSGMTLGRGGSISAVVDGYGTLKTPAGTFLNTLRVKLTQRIADTFYLSGQYYSDDETNTVSYNWIAQTHPGLTLMNISTGSSFTQTIDYAYYVEGTPTAIEEAQNEEIQFSIFPNPSNGFIHLRFGNFVPTGMISLFDITGREVKSIQISGHNSETINTAGIPKGIYMLKLFSENGNASKRVVIE